MADHTTQQLISGLRELASYPVQVEGTLVPGGGGQALSDGTSVVDRALRQVLGGRTRIDDVAGFRTALDRSFAEETVDGTRRTMLRPSASLVAGGEDLPSVQASLFTRASDVVDRVDRLLPLLKPLRVDADAEDIAATAGVVRDAVTRLRDEFGRPDGPRVVLVDQHWRILLGDVAGTDRVPDPDLVGGALGSLRGMLGSGVNSTDEERQVTQFRLVVDYVAGLWVGWLAAAGSFGGGAPGGASLGGTVRRLRLQFTTVQEAIDRVRSALDSVYVGEAERRIHYVTPPDRPDERLSVADLLDWASSLVGPEADTMVRDGGRIAITSYLLPNAERVARLLDDAATADLPGGLGAGRVRSALEELAGQFSGVAEEMALAVPPAPDLPASLRLVPDVVGAPLDAADGILTSLGFVVEPRLRLGTGLPGVVEETDPQGGELAVTGCTVVVFVTEWPTVPEVVGETLPVARRVLEEIGLSGRVTEHRPSAAVPLGTVIESDPVAGTPLPVGDGVGLVVSTGGYDEPGDVLCVLAGIVGDVLRDGSAAWEALRRAANGQDDACSPAVGRAQQGIEELVRLLGEMWVGSPDDSALGGLRARVAAARATGPSEDPGGGYGPPPAGSGAVDYGTSSPDVPSAADRPAGSGAVDYGTSSPDAPSAADRPAAEVVAGLETGELDPSVVVEQESERSKPRPTVMRAAEQARTAGTGSDTSNEVAT